MKADKTNTRFELHDDFWKSKIASLESPFRLGRGRDRSHSLQKNQRILNYSSKCRSIIKRIGRSLPLGEFLVTTCAIQCIIYRLENQTQIVFDTPILKNHGGDDWQAKQHTPIINSINGDTTIKELLSVCKSAMIESYHYQNYPVNALISDRLTNLVIGNPQIHAEFVKDIDYEMKIVIGFQDVEHRILLEYYSTEFYDYFVSSFEQLFERVVLCFDENVELRVKEIDILSEVEKEMVAKRFNDNFNPEYFRDESLAELFVNQVKKTPDRVVLSEGQNYLTYSFLDRMTSRLAHLLGTKYGLKRGDSIGVYLESNEEMISALLAIQKLGCVYVPISWEQPHERVRQIANDANLVLLIFSMDMFELAQSLGVPLFPMDLMFESHSDDCEEYREPFKSNPDDLAYIIYTSGSTGSPKGIRIMQRSIVNRMLFFLEYLSIQKTDAVIQFASQGFDASLYEIFMALLSGARLVLLNSRTKTNTNLFLSYVEKHHVTVMTLPPAFLSILNRSPMPSVRIIVSTGDKASWDDAVHYSNFVDFYNGYGPSETCIGATFYKVSYTRVNEYARKGSIPIGVPFANTEIYILDADLNILPIGIVGEICVGGIGLANGYQNLSGLTSEKFVQNPNSGSMIYRTGDLGRWNRDGQLEFVGRLDDQVQVRGIRTEVGDIEAAFLKHEQVKSCVVVPISQDGDFHNAELVAYLISKNTEVPIEIARLRAFLKEQLPLYMIPTRIFLVDSYPLSLNGKIDRAKLANIKIGNIASEGNDPSSFSRLEAEVAEVWGEILNVSIVSRDDNFFELGGHSLLATQIVSIIQNRLGYDLSVRDLFEHPSIAALAEKLSKTYRRVGDAIPIIEEQQYYGCTSEQLGIYINSMASATKTENPYHLFDAYQIQGKLAINSIKDALFTLAERHESLRTEFRLINGALKQIINPSNSRFNHMFDVIDAVDLSKDSITLDIINSSKQIGFKNDTLVKVKVYRRGTEQHIVVFFVHHIICDGQSLGIFFSELLSIYKTLAYGVKSQLTLLPVQYKDYSAWKNAKSQEPQRSFWMTLLGGELPTVTVAPDFQRGKSFTYNGDFIKLAMTPEESKGFSTFCSNERMTLFSGLLTALKILVHKRTGNTDVLLGTTISTRSHNDLMNQIGMYSSTVPVRIQMDTTESIRAFAQRLKMLVEGIIENSDFPIGKMIQELDLKRDMSRGALFDIAISVNKMPTILLNEIGDAKFESFAVGENKSKVDLLFNFNHNGDTFDGVLEYNSDLYSRSTVTQLASQLRHVMSQIERCPERKLGDIDVEDVRLISGFI